MVSLTDLQKSFILSHLHSGDTAVDFTMGNGYDTLFLSQTVGVNGKVYAFDIQQSALLSTKSRLVSNNAYENYILINDSHHKVKQYVSEPIKAGIFNLGYLPGSGNKGLTTKCETTLSAVTQAIELLDKDSVLIIAIYPGHSEGEIEGIKVGELLSTLNRKKFCSAVFRIVNSPTSPYFYVVESK